jgi:hypothetical protein
MKVPERFYRRWIAVRETYEKKNPCTSVRDHGDMVRLPKLKKEVTVHSGKPAELALEGKLDPARPESYFVTSNDVARGCNVSQETALRTLKKFKECGLVGETEEFTARPRLFYPNQEGRKGVIVKLEEAADL